MARPCKCGHIPDLDQLPQGYTCMCEAVEQVNNSELLKKTFPVGPFAGGENTADKLRRIKGGHHG